MAPVGRHESRLSSRDGCVESARLKSPVCRHESRLCSPVGSVESQLNAPADPQKFPLNSPDSCQGSRESFSGKEDSPYVGATRFSRRGYETNGRILDDAICSPFRHQL